MIWLDGRVTTMLDASVPLINTPPVWPMGYTGRGVIVAVVDTGVDHPYRWGLGAPLAPGEARTITGAIRMKNAQSKKFWVGLVQEYVAWLQDRQGKQTIVVT